MKKIFTVSYFTILEIYKSRLPLGLLMVAFFQFLITLMASEFTYGSTDKISLDFSLGIMSLSNQLISIFLGSTLISKEIESKTLYMILSRPISRTQFLLGKSIGLASVVLINTIFLTVLGIAIFVNYEGVFHDLIIWAALFSFLESLILMACTTMFSLLSNTTLSVLFGLGVLIVGHTYEATIKVAKVFSGNWLSKIIENFSFFIPNLSKLNLKDSVIYKQNLEPEYLLNMGLYAFIYIAAVYILVSVIFKHKNLD